MSDVRNEQEETKGSRKFSQNRRRSKLQVRECDLLNSGNSEGKSKGCRLTY